MLRRLGIRGKVLAALSVPVLVLFGLAGLVSWQAVQDVRSSRAVQDVLDALEQNRLLADALQDERSVTLEQMGLLAGAGGISVEEVREDTDTAVNRFTTASSKIDFAALDPTIKAAFDRVSGVLGILRSARNFADGGQVAMSVIQQQYDSVMSSVVQFPEAVSQGLADRQLAVIVAAGGDLGTLEEAYERERVLGRETLAGVHAGQPDATALNTLAEAINENNDLRNDVVGALNTIGLDPDDTIPESILVTAADQDFGNYRRSMSRLDAAGVAQIAVAQTILPTDWVAGADSELEDLAATGDAVDDLASARSTAVANAALREAALSISVTALAVIFSVVIALSIARAIVRPVRRLTEAAATVRDELPHLVEQVAIPGQGPDLRLTKIPIESRDEIGRLAAAFNEVNATTIEVAQEQAALRASIAEMFVNVARRDQVLLNRQLSFIDALERSEEDPKTLADLFRLDHLATRMRRNSESLLVLAGIDTGRRLREPLPTSDVIRTASSEIEHYERIQLELPVDPLMLGHTALPTAHMLAEILENATVFSDPGTPVHVSTGIDETAVIITVQDQGLGMTPEELIQANARLETSSASDVLGAQRLGLYVVGRIAARLGASVHMGTGPDGKGTLVTVRMPLVLFVNPGAIPITPPTAAPARVESFVLPEEAAAVVHDTAYAPVPDVVQDVAAGALGSVENPAQAVDLAALVEGTTETGLPKRRSHADAPTTWDMSAGNAAAASAIPLAPNPEALADAALAGAGEVWQPPVTQLSAPLSPRRRQEEEEEAAPAPSSGLPQRQRSAPTTTGGMPLPTTTAGQPPVPQSSVGGTTQSGLPTRRPAAPVGPPAREAVDTASATGPVNAEGRTAMFVGFRSRRAELAAAAVHEAGAGEEDLSRTDAVDRLAAAATGAAAFFQRPTTDAAPAEVEAPGEPPMVIPALVDDDEYGDLVAPVAQAPVDEVPSTTVRSADEVPFEVFAGTPAPGWPPAAVQAEVAPEEPPAPAETPWVPAAAVSPVPVETPWEPAAPAESPWAPAASAEPVAETPWAPAPVAAAPAEPENPWAAVAGAAQAPAPMAPLAEAPAAPAVPTPSWAATTSAPPAAAAPALPPYVPPTVDFAELVHGPTRRSLREQSTRRRWFRRSRGEAASQAAAPVDVPPFGTGVAAPAAPAVAAPPVEAPAPAGDFSVFAPTPVPSYVPPPVAEPVRQSAWGAPTAGSHVVEPSPAPEAPVADSAVEAVPAASAPAPGPGAAPTVPAEEQAVWQPAPAASWTPDTWQEPAASAPVAPLPSRGGPVGAPSFAAPAPVPPAPVLPAYVPPAASPAPIPAPSPAPVPATPPAPSPYSGPQTFTPQPMYGFDDEMTSMLAQRADIAEQALAELNQLSTYRPQAVSGSSSSKLQRRTPTAVPAAPAIATSASPRPARDANQVRSLLSSFQTGTSRGRGLAGNGAQQTTGENGHAGAEGPDGHGEPVPIPDTDLSTREASW